MSVKQAALFVPGEAEGAISNGAKIIKIAFEQGDHNPIGTLGVVLASHGPIDLETGEFGYFVEWDTLPGLPVFVRGRKIEAEAKDTKSALEPGNSDPQA